MHYSKCKTKHNRKRGSAYTSTAIKILTSVVVGAVLLFGIVGVMGDVVLPTASSKVNSLFAVNTDAGNPGGGSGGSGQPGGEGGVPIPDPVVELKRNGIIPEGGTYTVSATNTILSAGENFPETPATGDIYEEGDHKYRCSGNGWSVQVKDKTKSSYGEIIPEIAGKPINDMDYTFYGCTNLITAPTIPSSVTSMLGTFEDCTSLTTAPSIPNGVMSMWETFMDCKSLTVAPTIPDSVIYMYDTFYNCRSLKTYEGSTDADGDFSNYIIPNSVTDMNETFMYCTSLTTAPIIPNSVTSMYSTFGGCTSLTGTIEVNANPTSYSGCLSSTQITGITGSCTQTTKNSLMRTK